MKKDMKMNEKNPDEPMCLVCNHPANHQNGVICSTYDGCHCGQYTLDSPIGRGTTTLDYLYIVHPWLKEKIQKQEELIEILQKDVKTLTEIIDKQKEIIDEFGEFDAAWELT